MNLESFTDSDESVEETEVPNSTPMFLDMSKLFSEADAPDLTATPDQLLPDVMLLEAMVEPETVSALDVPDTK